MNFDKEITIDEYLRERSYTHGNDCISTFNVLLTGNYEFNFIMTASKDDMSYKRHAHDLYYALTNLYQSIIYHNLISNDIYSIITYISCSGNIAPTFITKNLLDFIKSKIIAVGLVGNDNNIPLVLNMVKDIVSNNKMLHLLLEHMCNTFQTVKDMNTLMGIFQTLNLNILAILTDWKNSTTGPYKDSADLLIRVYTK